MSQETNQQYYQGAQPFLVTDADGQTAFPTTFDTDLIFGSSDPTDIDYALNNFKVYTSTTGLPDRKSTRLNSSHGYISYAVFCLKTKKEMKTNVPTNTL